MSLFPFCEIPIKMLESFESINILMEYRDKETSVKIFVIKCFHLKRALKYANHHVFEIIALKRSKIYLYTQ